MVAQRNSWADEEVDAINVTEQVHGVSSKRRVRRVRQRAHRGSSRQACCEATSFPKLETTQWNETSANCTTSGACVWNTKEEEPPREKMCNPDEVLPTVGPQALLSSTERCNEVITRLECGDQTKQHETILSLRRVLHQLALSKSGCRVVQKAFDVGGPARDLIIAELKDHVVELYESPHGNHVLSKAIEALPAVKTGFVTAALLGRGVTVSKHRFGCRVMCRLIEHCTEDQIGHLLDEILSAVDELAHDNYGNFVVQAVLEHTSQERRLAVQKEVLPGFASLVRHRTGSLVAQRMLDHCSSEGQRLAMRALLQAEGENSLIESACSHFGSYVIEQIAGLQHSHSEALEIASILASNSQRLLTSQHAQRVLIAFGLVTSEPTGTPDH